MPGAWRLELGRGGPEAHVPANRRPCPTLAHAPLGRAAHIAQIYVWERVTEVSGHG